MDLALDSSGDLAFEDGDLVLLDGTEAIAQHLAIRFRFFLGEWFLDQRIGMPFYQKILVKNPNLALVRSLFNRAALDTPGILSVEKLETNFNAGARTLALELRATGVDGPVTISEEFIL